MEHLFKLLLIFPCFCFFNWIDKANRDSKFFTFFYYFYWIYITLYALFSLAWTVFSVLFFNIVLRNVADIKSWGIWLLLLLITFASAWLTYIFFKKMFHLRRKIGKSKGGRPWFISVSICRRWLMARLKSFISCYSKVYIGLVLFIWLAFFFVLWGNPIMGVKIDIFIIQKILLVFGILSILMALLSKKVSLFIFGIVCCLSLWINLFILFAILPIFGNWSIIKDRKVSLETSLFFLFKMGILPWK